MMSLTFLEEILPGLAHVSSVVVLIAIVVIPQPVAMVHTHAVLTSILIVGLSWGPVCVVSVFTVLPLIGVS